MEKGGKPCTYKAVKQEMRIKKPECKYAKYVKPLASLLSVRKENMEDYGGKRSD